ncbi:MAG: hypothetical protein IT427_06390 [Pirellulales bacterium]|nr:hypothetical protein [Pirellulales bacterium]
MKTLLSTSLALAVVLFGIAAANADFSKPMLVVSLASYDEQKTNIDFVGELAGQPNVSTQLEGFLNLMTQGRGLKGLDKSKPWGLVLAAEEDTPQVMAFLPVSSAKDLADSLAGFVGPAQDEGNGILKINPPGRGQAAFIREQNGWAFVTLEKYEAELPSDPLKLIDGLNTQYDVAFRGYLQNISSSKKQEWIDTLEGLQTMSGQSGGPISPELQREAQALQLKMIERWLNDADQVTLGWKIDKEAKNTHVDFSFTAVAGTSLAEGIKGFENPTTDLAGFLDPTYAVKLLTAHKHSQDHIEFGLAMANVYRKAALEAVDNDEDLASDEDRQSVKTALNDLFDVADATIKTGKSDVGLAVNLAPETIQIAAGTILADGPQLEKAVKNLLELAKGEQEFQDNVSVSFDVETYKDIRFHQAKIKVPDERAQKVLGENLDVYLGVGAKVAYLAAGKDSLTYIKSIIDSSATQSGKKSLPLELSISLADIFEFGWSVRPEDSPGSAKLEEQVKALKGKDHILVTVKPIAAGLTARLELEGGALQMIEMLGKVRASAGRNLQGAAQDQ